MLVGMEVPQESPKGKRAIWDVHANMEDTSALARVELRSQERIIKDAKDLLARIEQSPSLKPEAVVKLAEVERKKIKEAEAEIERTQERDSDTIQ